jgi:hypothetical protein
MKFNHETAIPFSFDLTFANDSLLGPSAHIIVGSCSKDEIGTTYLTPDCITPEEFHYHIDRLQAELERLRYRGIRKFIGAMNGVSRKKRR